MVVIIVKLQQEGHVVRHQVESLRNTTRLLTTSQRSLETSAVTPSSRKPARQHQFCNAEFLKARHRDNTEVFRVSRTLEGDILLRFQYIVYSSIEICRLGRLFESQYFINRLDLFIVVVKQHGAAKQSTKYFKVCEPYSTTTLNSHRF